MTKTNIPKYTNIDKLSEFAEPDMNICKFVSKYGDIGSSLVFADAIKKSDMTKEHKDIAFSVIADMQQSIKLLRKEGSCDCKNEF